MTRLDWGRVWLWRRLWDLLTVTLFGDDMLCQMNCWEYWVERNRVKGFEYTIFGHEIYKG